MKQIRFWRYTVSVILLSFILLSCENEIVEPLIETFPMSQGSEWRYQRTVYLTVFESDSSDLVVDIDTFQNLYKIRVAKDTVLNDTMYVTRFESFEEESVDYIWQQYYFLDEEGLKLYGYYRNPGPISLGKSAPYSFSGPSFSMERNLEFLSPGSMNGWIIFNPPNHILKLPLKKDSFWTRMQSNSSPISRIDKRVTGTDLLKIDNMEFSCFRVEWLYFYSIDGFDIQVTEWIAEEGLIKRILKHGRTMFVNLDGEYLYSGQFEEIVQLVDLHLN